MFVYKDITQPALITSCIAVLFFGSKKYKFKWRTQIKHKRALLGMQIALLLDDVCWDGKWVRVGLSLFSLRRALNAKMPKIRRASSAAPSSYSRAVSGDSIWSRRKTCLLSYLHSCCWFGLTVCFSLCFSLSPSSDTWFPLDWKQVCWKLPAVSSLHNVHCCLALVWK